MIIRDSYRSPFALYESDSDEGLTLETSVFESFTVANLPYMWLIIYFSVSLSHRRSTQFLSKLNPLYENKLCTEMEVPSWISRLFYR